MKNVTARVDAPDKWNIQRVLWTYAKNDFMSRMLKYYIVHIYVIVQLLNVAGNK
jgi:hypothetical protein